MILRVTLLIIASLNLQVTFAQWTTQQVTQGRFHQAAASIDDQLFFGGGSIQGLGPSDLVEIYNTTTQIWSQTELSVARSFPAATTNGSKVYFAGGNHIQNGENYDIIDIYDANTETWSTQNLSSERSGITAASISNKVFFAGGGVVEGSLQGFETETTIDIYNTLTETWSIAQLSEPRMFLSSIVLGDKAYFAGGLVNDDLVSKRVDIYDFTTDTWTIDSLSEARMFLSAVTIDGKIYFAGGNDTEGVSYSTVDIYDPTTGTWSVENLGLPRTGLHAASFCDKLYFIAGGDINWSIRLITTSYNLVDIYDPATNTWELDEIPFPRTLGAVAANSSDLVMIGGFEPGMGLHNNADFLSCTPSSTKNQLINQNIWRVYPNPTTGDAIHIEILDPNLKPTYLQLYNNLGVLISSRAYQSSSKSRMFEGLYLSPGVYFVKMVMRSGAYGTRKIVVQKAE